MPKWANNGCCPPGLTVFVAVAVKLDRFPTLSPSFHREAFPPSEASR